MKTQTSSLEFSHFPVMLSEIIKICHLLIKAEFLLIVLLVEAVILKHLLKFPKTKVIGIDRDKSSYSISRKIIRKIKNRFFFIK